jgi:four helix bundle protein
MPGHRTPAAIPDTKFRSSEVPESPSPEAKARDTRTQAVEAQERHVSAAKRLQDLVAWQKAMALAVEVYRFSARFPDHERFGLQAQIRRAAVSVPSNVAEGFGRQTQTDMTRFLRIARGSLFEVRTQVVLAERLGYVAPDDSPHPAIDEADRVLQGLIRSLTPPDP